jgi:cation diffusion facilitator CzcD-associated flavoprotein CzcO
MPNATTERYSERTAEVAEFDAIVIGAGVAGLYQLYRLRSVGLKVQAFEAGQDVGGTWYWNRYPGARFDSESYSYAYSFSQELLEEWNWSEHFAAQPETLRYYNYVADKFDLRGSIKFNLLVTAVHYKEKERIWEVALSDGSLCRARFVIAAVGVLTVPTFPNIEGRESFAGESFHTSRWPHETVSFRGKRVGVIGTGATGVQIIQEVAKTAGSLTVFQRTPNYCVPINNGKISETEQSTLKANYPKIFERCRRTAGWFLHTPDERSVFDVPDLEREAFFERLYADRGLGIWQGNFRDILTDPEANAVISEFIRKKIRARIKDPAIADKLVPKNHGFGSRRVPLENGYYDVFNQPNVTLVDLIETPIQNIFESGVRTASETYELDMLIYATGFDAVTGSFDRIDIRGVNGLRLKEKWTDGPQTFLGLMTAGFPNFFMPGGPLSALGNIPRALEYGVDWISSLIEFMTLRGFTVADAPRSKEREWTNHAKEIASRLLASQTDSWFSGVNGNIGKFNRTVVLYRGGAPLYRERCEEVASGGYRELHLE